MIALIEDQERYGISAVYVKRAYLLCSALKPTITRPSIFLGDDGGRGPGRERFPNCLGGA